MKIALDMLVSTSIAYHRVNEVWITKGDKDQSIEDFPSLSRCTQCIPLLLKSCKSRRLVAVGDYCQVRSLPKRSLELPHSMHHLQRIFCGHVKWSVTFVKFIVVGIKILCLEVRSNKVFLPSIKNAS